MRSRNFHKLAAVVLTAAMLCNTTVTAWASSTTGSTGNTVTPTAQDTAAIKTALTSGLEAKGQKPALPRLLPSDTKVKAVGRITVKDIPLYFDPTEESNVYILLPLDALVSVMEDLDDWFRISYNDCTGFISPEYVELLKRSETFETYGVVDAEELPLRELRGCPPFCDLLTLTFHGRQEQAVWNAAQRFRATLAAQLAAEYYRGETVQLLGPAPAQVARVNYSYRCRLTLSCRNTRTLRELVAYRMREFLKDKANRGIGVYADVNGNE